ncbi:hypothetical protein OG21DRAFT_1230107 [Imleria badia]|nr:hypothetical protein OG21DRAFT_1230107 [Imleria badia]
MPLAYAVGPAWNLLVLTVAQDNICCPVLAPGTTEDKVSANFLLSIHSLFTTDRNLLQDLDSSNTATFGRPHETKEKLGVVIKLTRSDEIIYISFYREVAQTFRPNSFITICRAAYRGNVQARQAWGQYVRVLSFLLTQMF